MPRQVEAAACGICGQAVYRTRPEFAWLHVGRASHCAEPAEQERPVMELVDIERIHEEGRRMHIERYGRRAMPQMMSARCRRTS